MIAKVKTENGTVYDTVVFADIADSWNSRIIGFDETLETIREIPYYHLSPERHITQLLIIIDSDQEGWITDDSTDGYDWLISDKRYLQMIQDHAPLPEEIFARCKALQDALNLPEWREVTDEKSVENLMRAAGGFHDGMISAIQTEDDFTTVSMEIWGGIVHIRLENAELSENCIVNYGNMGEILDSSLFFENGRIFWTDEWDVRSTDEFFEELGYFSGTRMFWKIELD